MAIIFHTSVKPKYYAARGKEVRDDGRPEFFEQWKDWTWNYQLENKVRPIGVRIPDEFFPKQIRLIEGKKIYDYTSHVFGTTVSERFKNVIEEVEPGVHQFMPLEILHKDGTPYGEPYWAFRICSLIEAVNPELGGVKKDVHTSKPDQFPDRWDWKFDVSKPDFKDRLAVHKEKIEGRAAWIDKRFMPQTSRFLSDSVVERLHAVGMEGWDETSHWQEL